MIDSAYKMQNSRLFFLCILNAYLEEKLREVNENFSL